MNQNVIRDVTLYCLLHYLYEKPPTEWEFNVQGKNTMVKADGSSYASRTYLLLKYENNIGGKKR